MCSSPRSFFLTGLRLMFGAWLLYAGLMKWVVFGPQGFIGFIHADFDKTWSPAILNEVLAWLILIAEPVLAVGLLVGWRQRCVWTMTALLMYMLLLGQTILMKPELIANWQYTLLALACAAWSGPDEECQTA